MQFIKTFLVTLVLLYGSTGDINAQQTVDSFASQYSSPSLEAQKKDPSGTLYCKSCPVAKCKNPAYFNISFIITLLVVLFISGFLLSKTAIARDLSYDPETQNLRPTLDRPYSYAKVQLLWWTAIVLSCMISFYFATGSFAAINTTMVALLGLGVGTSLLGKAIDDSQIRENNNPVPNRHQDNKTNGFLRDIFSDEGGITISRFQGIVFNIVFGIVFFREFVINVKCGAYPFPEFEVWQLSLIGISAAGYLSMKTQENSSETKPARENEIFQKPLTAAIGVQSTTGTSVPNDVYMKRRAELLADGRIK
ncbi:MAG: hypothetical protein ACK5OP_02805 [Sphingobacteriales bacterium]|jgi:hypothetical protein